MTFAAEYKARCYEYSDISAHLPYLFERASKAQTIVELGVRSGNSTAALLAGAEEASGHVWSVDIDPPRVPSEWAQSGLWTMTVGDDCSPNVTYDMPVAIDLLFIDTSHHYEHTLLELQLYGARVQPGGVILLHDVELEMPHAWIGEPYPVRRAIEAWCAETGNTATFIPGSYGLGVIEVGNGD